MTGFLVFSTRGEASVNRQPGAATYLIACYATLSLFRDDLLSFSLA